MCNCLLQSVLLACTLLELVQSRQCGFPGRPRNGTSTTSSLVSRPGDTARYKCQPGFTLFGDEERVCLNSGIWAGRQPICALNLARGRKALLRTMTREHRAALTVDGKLETCSYLPSIFESRWLMVDLGKEYVISMVGVFIGKGVYQDFTISVVRIVNRQAYYEVCKKFQGRLEDMMIFECNKTARPIGSYIHIMDDRGENPAFGICEIEVFSFSERVLCGEPEEPVAGHVFWSPEGPAMYTCEHGKELTAEPNRTCETDGRWAGHAPQCKVIECRIPRAILFGYYDLRFYTRTYFPYGTSVTYKCRIGYRILGHDSITCSGRGTWTMYPVCKPIMCSDPPPKLPNTEVELLNKSTSWNSIAEYSCKSGYSSQEGTLQALSTCLSSGLWEEVNISCEQDASLHKLGTLQGTGWSHRSQDTGSDLGDVAFGAVGIIIIVATLAIIIILVVVGVSIFLARRCRAHKAEQPVKSPGDNDLILNNRKDDTYDDVAAAGYTVAVKSDANKTLESKVDNIAYPVVMNNQNLFPQAADHSSYNALNSFPSGSSYNSTLATDTDEELNYARVKARRACEPGYEAVQIEPSRLPMYPEYEAMHAGGDSSYEPIHTNCLPDRQMRMSSRSIHLLPSALKIYNQPNNKLKMQPDLVDENLRVSQEILALYAQVDKTKKVRYRCDGKAEDDLEEDLNDPTLHMNARFLEDSSGLYLSNVHGTYEPFEMPPAPLQYASSPPHESSENSMAVNQNNP